jgi:hypothetical protein
MSLPNRTKDISRVSRPAKAASTRRDLARCEYRGRDQDGTIANFGNDLGHESLLACSPCLRHRVGRTMPAARECLQQAALSLFDGLRVVVGLQCAAIIVLL